MEENNSIFQGNIEDLETLEIDQYFAKARHPVLLYYSDALLQARKEAEEKGDSSAESAYRFLYELVSFSPDFADPAFPYRSGRPGKDKAHMVPEDFSDEDLEVVRKLLERTQDPSLKARLLDLLWLNDKKYVDDCIRAVESYTESAKRLEPLDDEFSWVYAKNEYHRALQLARFLGPKSVSYKNASDAIIEAIGRSVDRDIKEQPYHYMEIAREHQVGDPVGFAEIANKFGNQLKSEKDFYWSIKYFELEAEFWRFAQQADKKQVAQIEVGESYVAKAKDCVSTGQGHYAAATQPERWN